MFFVWPGNLGIDSRLKSSSNGRSTTSKTCRNLPKTSFKLTTGADFSPELAKIHKRHNRRDKNRGNQNAKIELADVQSETRIQKSAAERQFKTGNAGRFDTGFPAAFFS